MPGSAEAQPARVPLAQGSSGAAVRVHPLLTGTCIAPPNFFAGESGLRGRLRNLGVGVPREQWVRIPIVAFLLEHPTLGPMMIDTGLHPSVAVDPRQNLGWSGPMILRDIEFEPSEAAPAQLRRRGVDPRAVRLVLMTHMHLDHASAVSEFADATFVVAEAEWRAATASLGVLRGYVASQFDHAVEVRLLDFEAAEVDSLSGFGRALDLFGDGSVHAVYTPGHTVGHVSYVVRTAGSEVLVAGDAIYAMRTLRESVMPWRVEDAHNFRRSLREIQLYARETPGAVIVPGHDLERWNELEPVY